MIIVLWKTKHPLKNTLLWVDVLFVSGGAREIHTLNVSFKIKYCITGNILQS